MEGVGSIDEEDMNSDDFFWEVFQESPVPTIILKGDAPDFTIIEVNRKFEELSNRSRGELAGNGFFKSSPHPAMATNAETITVVRQSLDQVVREKNPVRSAPQKYTGPLTGAEPSAVLYLQATNKPVLDENNEIKYIIRTIKDVTESVTAQLREHEINEMLSDNEKFLKDTQRVAKIGSWEVDKHLNVKWSQLHYEIFETGPDFLPILEDGINFFKDDDNKTKFRRVFDTARATGEAFDEEFEVVTAQGNARWLRLIGQGEISNGEFRRMYGVAQDITAHKMLELRLLHSRDYFEDIIHNIQGVVWEADVETLQVTFMSDKISDMLGYTKDECVSNPEFWHDHLHPEDKTEVISQTKAMVKACKNLSLEYRMRKKDGSYIWVLDSFAVVRENSRPALLRGLMIDISKPKLLADLEHLEKMVLELNSSSKVSLEQVLEYYLRGLEAIFPEMVCSIMKVKQGQVHIWVAPSLPAQFKSAVDKVPIGERAGSCGTAAFRKETVIVSDIASDLLWEDYRDLALEEGLHAGWSHPIFNSEGEVLATLAMYYGTVKAPTEEELKVVARTASILTVIIENRQNASLLEETNFLMKQSEELARFGSLHWDIPSNKLTWSKEMYSIFGMDPEVEVTEMGHFEMVHPDDRKMAREKVAQLFATRQDQIFDERIIRPNGEIRHLKTWIRLKTDSNGLPIQMIGACLDTTESKKFEERLVASEQRLRNILNSQTNYVVRIGLDSKYKYTNKKFAEDFAFDDEEDLIGLESLRTVREDQKEKVKKVLEECIAHPGRVVSIELEKLSPRFPNKATFWHFICLTDSKGDPYEIQGIGIDISQRKKAEKEREKKELELKISEKRYSDLFHLSPQPMYLYDVDSLKFLDVNAAAIAQYGYSREEFLTITVLDIRPEEEAANFLNELETIKKSGVDFYRGTYIQKTKQGEILHVDLHSNLIPFEGKKARLVLAGNITDRIKYLERLEVQNSKLREIAWAQSHVVRAPLARIMALIDMIKNYPELNEENEELLGYIFSSAVELDEVIRDISRKAEEVKLDDMDRSEADTGLQGDN